MTPMEFLLTFRHWYRPNKFCKRPRYKRKLVVVNGVSYGCQRSKDRGKTVCPGFLINRKKLEKQLLNSLKNNLLTDSAAEKFENYFEEEVNKLLNSNQFDIEEQKKRLTEINTSIEKIIEAIALVGVSDTLASKLKSLEAEKANITQR